MRALAFMESPVKYHPDLFGCLTSIRYPDQGPCLVGSLTGAVASQRVTEARKGSLRPEGNLILRLASHLDAFSGYPFHT